MSDPYEWLHAEQQRIANEGTEKERAFRSFRRKLLASAFASAAILTMAALVGLLPRNSSGAINYPHLAATNVFVALVCISFLWIWRVDRFYVRVIAWACLCFALLTLFAGALDYFRLGTAAGA